MRPGLPFARSSDGANLAALGHLSIPDAVARQPSANKLPGARRAGGACALGRTAEPLHGLVRAFGDRLAAFREPAGGGATDGTDLGRGPRDHGACGTPRFGAAEGPKAALSGGG